MREPIKSPTDKSFFMTYIFSSGAASENEKCREYLKTLRKELCGRLMDKLYNPEWGTLDLKFWVGLYKHDFLGMKWKSQR